MAFDKIANDKAIERAAKALASHGVEVFVVRDRAEAKAKFIELVPEGSEIYTMSSATLAETGIKDEVDGGSRYVSIHDKVTAISDKGERFSYRRKASACQYATGSVHAVTEDGQAVIASQSGSQLAPYAYAAERVVWVVGAQKIVKDLEMAQKRIREYVFPLEDARMKKEYGPQSGSGINKVLTFSKEVVPGRVRMILVKEKLGF